jgi:hypothetical protein
MIRSIQQFLTWKWTKATLYWLIMSAGTISGLALLCASLWMSINSSVHPFLLLFMSDDITKFVSYLAVISYIGLPEIILFSAVVLTIGHYRLWRYTMKWHDCVWVVLYGVPALTFLLLSLYTVGSSVLKIGFIMPDWLIVLRALACYTYAGAMLLHHELGEPQVADMLLKKDGLIAEIHQKFQQELLDTIEEKRLERIELSDHLTRQIEALKVQNEALENTISTLTKTRFHQLQNGTSFINEMSLQAYSDECKKWVMGTAKTATVDEINLYTGHSKQRIMGAIRYKKLELHTRGTNLVLMSSLRNWLAATPPQIKEQDTDGNMPVIHLLEDHRKTGTLEQ